MVVVVIAVVYVGTIAIVDNEGTIIETIQEATESGSEDDYSEDDY